MAASWGREGYQLVDEPREQPERVPAVDVLVVMQSYANEPALRMRALAAQLRAHAAETSMDHFRRKFEVAASELEENALDIESRAGFREKLKLVS